MDTMKNNGRWFTAFRFEDGFSSDAEAKFKTLASYGLTPQWATEAPSKKNPLRTRALLIQLPKVEADKYRKAQSWPSYPAPRSAEQ